MSIDSNVLISEKEIESIRIGTTAEAINAPIQTLFLKRFEEKGIFKAFIDIDGKPLIKYCTDNLPFPFLLKEIRIFFIVLKNSV